MVRLAFVYFAFAIIFFHLQDTCRMAAPEFRYGLEVQQTSVQNRPIFFARSRSSLVSKPLTVFAITESLSSIFHLDTTQWEKKYFVISLLHRHLTSFNECPRVLPVVSIWNISVNSIAEKPWAILKTSIKSARYPLYFDVLPKSTVPVSVTWLHIVTT